MKENNHLKLPQFLILAFVLLGIALFACPAGVSAASGGKLIMATNAEFPPYEYYDGQDIVGIDVEIAQAIAEEMDMELLIEDMAFDAIITAVTSGKADFGAAGMTVTEDRLKSVNFSDTYTTSAQVIIVKEDSPIATPDDLTGKKIGVQLGTTGDIYSEDIEDAKIERYNKGFEAVQSLLSDKIDAVIIDQEPAAVFVSQNEGLKLTDEEFTTEEYALAIAKDNEELLKKVNTALASLKESGRLDEIKAKYINTSEEEADTPKKSGGKLIMATNAEFPPYEYYDGQDIVGIDAEIAQAIADEMGMELQIEDMAFDAIITAVTSGKADFGAAGMTVTEDRLKSVNFSDTYTQSAQVIIVKEDSPIATPDDLTGKKIGVQLGTTGDIYSEDIEDAKIERYNKGFEAVQSLLSDKIDAVIIDQEPAAVFVSQNEGLKLTDEEFTSEEYALAIAKDNTELLENINAALANLKKSGRLDEIKAKYISTEEKEDSDTPKETNGKLIMATNAEFPPYEYYDGQDIVGIDAEIAQAIADEMGMELQIEDMAFDAIITAVTSGKADFGAAGMTVTEDRLKSVNFSDTYTTSAQVIIVKENSPIATPDDLTGKRIGVQLGTTGDIYADDIEDAHIERYNKGFEAVQSLLSDKIDAVIIDQEPAAVFVKQNEGLKLTDEEFTTEEYALAIAKDNTELLEKVNAALANLKESGRLDEIKESYINTGDEKLSSEELDEALKSTINAEDESAASGGLKEALYDNLISKDRWKYIANGLAVTLEITLLAVILGIFIGFVIAIIRSTYEKTGNLKFLNALCQIYLTVIRGTPVLVQLLIIYYIIFASFTNKVVVASLAFGINSGAYVAEIIRGGILSIDNGQFEAGRSLGFNYLQTMIYIILPQALKNVLPALANEFVVLLKETSVCGYIALQDLTKGGDIIRSQTYNAYIPLLSVAVIYLAMVMIFTYFVKLLERRLRNSERR